MDNSQNLDPAIVQFVDVARRYCAWVESKPDEPLPDMQCARRLLAELHLAALNLPDIGVGEEVEASEVPAEDWKAVCQRFSHLPVNQYWDAFDPLKLEENDPVYWQLPDDLADIYRDVKDNLNLFEAGHIVEAVWEWRFSFRTHWGQHLLGAQRALHSYLQYEEW